MTFLGDIIQMNDRLGLVAVGAVPLIALTPKGRFIFRARASLAVAFERYRHRNGFVRVQKTRLFRGRIDYMASAPGMILPLCCEQKALLQMGYRLVC